MPGKCKFQDRWLSDEQFSKLIARVGSLVNEANCRSYRKSLDLVHYFVRSYIIHPLYMRDQNGM